MCIKQKYNKSTEICGNSKRKVPYQMKTSKAQTHQTYGNNCHIVNLMLVIF